MTEGTMYKVSFMIGGYEQCWVAMFVPSLYKDALSMGTIIDTAIALVKEKRPGKDIEFKGVEALTPSPYNYGVVILDNDVEAKE